MSSTAPRARRSAGNPETLERRGEVPQKRRAGALSARRRYRERRRPKLDLVLRYAEVCRVKNVMRPYLDALR